MSLLRAVAVDLYEFANEALFGRDSEIQVQRAIIEREPQELLVTDDEVDDIVADIEEDVSSSAQSFRSTEAILASDEQQVGGNKNTLMYVGGSEVPLFLRATREFDSVIKRLPYGAMVMVLEQRGQWSRVVYGIHSGWVRREDLVDRAAHVYPALTVGERYEHTDTNTLRIRAFIDDIFAGGVSELPLQSSEYIVYRLLRKGFIIPWPKIYPRTVGTWHNILRGVRSVSIGVSPKTGSVMEYIYSDGVGHLAYVESVHPDESIAISEILDGEQGEYQEHKMTRDEWQQLSPVFIQVV